MLCAWGFSWAREKASLEAKQRVTALPDCVGEDGQWNSSREHSMGWTAGNWGLVFGKQDWNSSTALQDFQLDNFPREKELALNRMLRFLENQATLQFKSHKDFLATLSPFLSSNHNHGHGSETMASNLGWERDINFRTSLVFRSLSGIRAFCKCIETLLAIWTFYYLPVTGKQGEPVGDITH